MKPSIIPLKTDRPVRAAFRRARTKHIMLCLQACDLTHSQYMELIQEREIRREMLGECLEALFTPTIPMDQEGPSSCS